MSKMEELEKENRRLRQIIKDKEKAYNQLLTITIEEDRHQQNIIAQLKQELVSAFPMESTSEETEKYDIFKFCIKVNKLFVMENDKREYQDQFYEKMKSRVMSTLEKRFRQSFGGMMKEWYNGQL